MKRMKFITDSLKQFGTFLLATLFAVTILTLPLKLIYVWGCFLWNLF